MSFSCIISISLVVAIVTSYIFIGCVFMFIELIYQSMDDEEIIISKILYNSWILPLKEFIIEPIYNIFKSFNKPWRWK